MRSGWPICFPIAALIVGCASHDMDENERRTRLFLAPGSMGLSMIVPAGGWRGLRNVTYSIALRDAAGRGDNNEVVRTITQGGEINHRDGNGWSALTRAVDAGHYSTTALLLETERFEYRKGALFVSTDRPDQSVKNEALAIAVQRRNVEITSLLLRNGASPGTANDLGQTVLMRAAHVGSSDLVRMLLAAGADRNAKDADGLTALDWARKVGCAGCQELLRDL
jgi:uncharacterized protein